MSYRRSIRTRRGKGRRQLGSGFELQITSLMDVLVILVVFLLKSYATSLNTFAPAKGIEVPKSAAETVPPDSLAIIVTPEAITFENERIVEFVQTESNLGNKDPVYTFKRTDLGEGGRMVVPLLDALTRSKDKSELLRVKSTQRDAEGKPLPFDGIVAIQADRRIDYDTLRRIMYTAASAGFRTFRFLALKKDS